MEKNDLIAGKHWVEAKNGEIGCVMENGIVFKEISINFEYYDNNLKHLGTGYSNKDPNFNIEKIFIVKGAVGNFNEPYGFQQIYPELLKPITSLDQLEEVRKELNKNSSYELYITNESGEWEIKYRTPCNCDVLLFGGKGEVIHKPFTIDLKREGYELKLGGEI